MTGRAPRCLQWCSGKSLMKVPVALIVVWQCQGKHEICGWQAQCHPWCHLAVRGSHGLATCMCQWFHCCLNQKVILSCEKFSLLHAWHYGAFTWLQSLLSWLPKGTHMTALIYAPWLPHFAWQRESQKGRKKLCRFTTWFSLALFCTGATAFCDLRCLCDLGAICN